jgi:hypothetical protein
VVLAAPVLDLLAGAKEEYVSLVRVSGSKGKELTVVEGVCGWRSCCMSWLLLQVMKLVIKPVYSKGRKYVRYNADADADAGVGAGAGAGAVAVAAAAVVVVVMVMIREEEEERKGRRCIFYLIRTIVLGSEVLVNSI